MKNNRGEITIMMIITVIALIIIGGVCIFMLTGDNGLFIPKRNKIENETTTNSTINEDEQNVLDNQNGALTVPME